MKEILIYAFIMVAKFVTDRTIWHKLRGRDSSLWGLALFESFKKTGHYSNGAVDFMKGWPAFFFEGQLGGFSNFFGSH